MEVGTVACDYTLMPLEELSAKISKLHDEAKKFAGIITQSATLSVARALAAGQALLVAKTLVKHGGWGQWLEANVPDLSADQANRYMKLARQIPHVQNLAEIKTVRQAYLVCGVVKAPVVKATKPKHLDDTEAIKSNSLGGFQSLREVLERVAHGPELGGVSLAERSEIQVEIEKIMEILEAIQRRLKL